MDANSDTNSACTDVITASGNQSGPTIIEIASLGRSTEGADSKGWLRTNEFEEAVLALESVAEFSEGVMNNPHQWKWVLIATHNAVQGFMVLALRCGNGLQALRQDVAAKWLQAYRQGGKYPKEKLDNFRNLYAKIKSDTVCFYVHSKKFRPGSTHDRSMEKLNELRNEFVHFVPKGWSLELAGLPGICLDSLAVLRFCGWECGNVFWHKDVLRTRAERALRKATRFLIKIQAVYEKQHLRSRPSRTRRKRRAV